MFVGRISELEFLEKQYSKKGGRLVVLYGRRRIGKTELLREFVKDKQHVFYSCTETTDDKQRQNFSKRLLKQFKGSQYIEEFGTWEKAIEYFASFSSDEKKVLVIDEFPYMVKYNREFPSILQNMWDSHLKNENIMVIICGSSMSFIENEILGEKNPLYGRTTGIYKLNPLTYDEFCQLVPNYSIKEQIEVYSLCGGIPHYALQIEDDETVEENIKENILTKGCTLYNEVEFLMKQELRDTNIYNTLIVTIAHGNTKLNEIHQKTGIDKAKIGVYLKNLMDLGIIEREFPITEKIKTTVNVQRGLYRITDQYFKFWYRFVFPNISELEEGDVKSVYEEAVEPFLSGHIGDVFESVCEQYMKKLNRRKELPIKFNKIGRYWDKTVEIDLMAFDLNGNFILGECKWRNEKVSLKVLESLEKKGRSMKMHSCYYYVFSKSGFSKEIIRVSEARNDVYLVDLKALELMNGEC